MIKIKKKILLLLIMLLFCACAGCADKDNKESKDGINTQNTVPETDNGTDLYYSEKEWLMGGTEIYPMVMVEGHLYEWRFGRAIGGRPSDSVYYGEINHVDGKTPTEDCDFVSVFSVSGQIYTVPGNNDCVYLYLTTDWIENKNVAFDLVE